MEIKLDLNDQEQMQKEILRVQKSFDELIEVCNDQAAQLRQNNEELTKSQKIITELNDSNLSMIEAFKGIFKTMSAKADILNKDKDLKELLDIMAKFMVSPAAIRAGVVENARKES